MNRTKTCIALRASLAVMFAALLVALAAPAAALAAVPDVGSATALVGSSGAISANVSASDPTLANNVWSFHLNAGDEVSFSASAPGATDVDVLLFGPGTQTIYGALPTAHSTFFDEWPEASQVQSYYPEQLAYVAPTTGTYYADIWCKSSVVTQSASANWAIWTAAANDRLPGVSAPASPITGTLDSVSNPDDFFTLPELLPNQQVQVSATSAAIGNLELAIWNPLFRLDPRLDYAWQSDIDPGSSPTIVADTPSYASGTPFWLQVHATSGSGAYSATWGVFDAATIDIAPTDPLLVPYGGSATVHGTVHDRFTGTTPANVPVELYGATGTTWSLAATTTTGIGGAYSVSLHPDTATAYYAAVGPGTSVGYAESDDVAWIIPKAYLTVPSAPSSVKHGAKFTSMGYLKPHHTAGTVVVSIYKYKLVGGTWKPYGYVSAKASDYSTYTKYAATLSLPSAGTWRIRALHDDFGHDTTWSGYRTLTVK